MQHKRYIPRVIFQISVLILLAIGLVIWARWLMLDSGPYHWLQQHLRWLGQRESYVFAGLLAFILIVLLWIPPTLILRYFSDLPWFTEEQNPLAPDQSPVDAFRHSLDAQRQKQYTMLNRPDDDMQRRRFFRFMGGIGLLVGGIGALATWLAWYLSGDMWLYPLLFAIVSLLGGGWSALTGRPGILNIAKIYQVRNVVNRVLIIVLILTMLFLAVMCVVQALQ